MYILKLHIIFRMVCIVCTRMCASMYISIYIYMYILLNWVNWVLQLCLALVIFNIAVEIIKLLKRNYFSSFSNEPARHCYFEKTTLQDGGFRILKFCFHPYRYCFLYFCFLIYLKYTSRQPIWSSEWFKSKGGTKIEYNTYSALISIKINVARLRGANGVWFWR